mgnify:CR=1 FL=1
MSNFLSKEDAKLIREMAERDFDPNVTKLLQEQIDLLKSESKSNEKSARTANTISIISLLVSIILAIKEIFQ